MKLRFVPAARAELYSVALKYERQRAGLGDRFLFEAERTIGYIKEHPLARTPILGDTRRWRLSHFPYGLLYAVESDVIYFLAVGHLRRTPKFWKQRSRRRRE